ncbi:hypothetical protein PIB30_023369 [Stylosanthes scabra]|uniref:Uncharacterized protein n=1 Tax=Stylosanthes scabra TaxID=79078 RepID=A0ABU6U8F8_9FABA|nr:hypothetical protein [Stylosanthes scabra]
MRMISILLLGCILVITAQGDSSSSPSVPTVSGLDSNQNKLEVTGIAAMHQKEPIIERSGNANMRKLWFGEKKKLTKHEEGMDSKNEGEKISTATHHQEISGNNVQYGLKSSFGSLGEQKKDQNKHMIMESKASRFTKFVIPRRSSGPANTNRKCSSQDCNEVAINERRMKSSPSSSRPYEQKNIEEEEQGTSHEKDERHHQSSLVEAEKEVANLIYKDYKGKPSHKPPINNNEPGN